MKSVWQHDDGKWYHRTEDEDMEGPFDSQSQAAHEYKKYFKWVNRPKPTKK